MRSYGFIGIFRFEGEEVFEESTFSMCASTASRKAAEIADDPCRKHLEFVCIEKVKLDVVPRFPWED